MPPTNNIGGRNAWCVLLGTCTVFVSMSYLFKIHNIITHQFISFRSAILYFVWFQMLTSSYISIFRFLYEDIINEISQAEAWVGTMTFGVFLFMWNFTSRWSICIQLIYCLDITQIVNYLPFCRLVRRPIMPPSISSLDIDGRHTPNGNWCHSVSICKVSNRFMSFSWIYCW